MEFGDRRYTNPEEECAEAWPYRTTPLVLPGAKAKHEAPTGSYLRHHPNPMMRSGPSHYEFLPQDVVMKQKVADAILQKIEQDEALAGKQIIRQQFNTPIGLYSNKNIVDTIHNSGFNTGLSRSSSFGRGTPGMAPRPAVKYDPAKSETFKALQEEQYGDGPLHEVTTPAQPKVFTPTKQPVQRVHQPPQVHTYDPTSHSSAPHHHGPYINSMGHPDNQIAQSGSFKRLMHMVLDPNY
ncbi:hypothetical protein RUM43_010862 [Polyplax serrata]